MEAPLTRIQLPEGGGAYSLSLLDRIAYFMHEIESPLAAWAHGGLNLIIQGQIIDILFLDIGLDTNQSSTMATRR